MWFFFEDVDECNSTISVCDVNAESENTIGSHSCSCKVCRLVSEMTFTIAWNNFILKQRKTRTIPA